MKYRYCQKMLFLIGALMANVAINMTSQTHECHLHADNGTNEQESFVNNIFSLLNKTRSELRQQICLIQRIILPLFVFISGLSFFAAVSVLHSSNNFWFGSLFFIIFLILIFYDIKIFILLVDLKKGLKNDY